MFDLNQCVGFITNVASKTLSDALNNKLMEHGVTKSQWIAMYNINKEKNLTQKSLSDLMGAKESTITGILDRLERENLILRQEDVNDRRKKNLVLTDKGELINKKLTGIAQEFRDICLSEVSEEDQKVFLEVLDKMVIAALAWKKE
ncbi:MarR family winged helix-turn-helix transcriptional regulator [uncultured Anaerococcus sp.]|uniref:MarR family winged helix-turn-helix transcriptional regulator n=1 Tax=uncultured Anaerococcus sp. TaxID=293428 RepID=UPI00260C1728|nr:MarR family transcriptional regulator [uncultured Anaerococcus sp.]